MERSFRQVLISMLLSTIFSSLALAQQGGLGDASHQKDSATYRHLLDNRSAIKRNVIMREDGVETITESDSPEITAKIREHVHAMKGRIEDIRPIHMRDPLFAAIFENAQTINLEVQNTDRGVRVMETSTHPYVVKLIQEHAKVVSNFIQYGYEEVRKNHELPTR